MPAITSLSAYLPRYRLALAEIGRMWGTKAGKGQKAIAGYDEDALTMAVACGLACLKGTHTPPDSLYFATTTSPYKEKQHAAIIAGALDLPNTCHTADFTTTLRAGTSALKAALDAVTARSSTQALVVASDCRLGAPKGRFEQLVGDGACALTIGTDTPLLEIEGTSSLFSDFTDLWRTDKDVFLQSGEARFIDEAGYMPVMEEAITALLATYSLTPSDFSKVVFSAPDSRTHATLSKKLGFTSSQVQDPLFSQIGNTGNAAALIMLVAALEEASPGDRILFATYGDGADTFIFRVTDRITQKRPFLTLTPTVPIDYGRYLTWRHLIPQEPSALPERFEPSLAARWRERKGIRALYGVKCKTCTTPQIHPIGQNTRICVFCQAKDDFEPYKFSDKTGTLFTYAVDALQPTLNPPGLNGVIDFDGGGRLICELTDYDLDTIETGMPVEMTFRKLAEKGIVNYFWKAKPL